MSAPPVVVLAIEDDLAIRRFLRTALTAQGYRLIETGTAEEGQSAASQHNPDVVLLDLGLPDLDGIQVIPRLRAWSKVAIIVLSARGAESDKIAALDAGADDYLTKPFATGELLARIRVALRRRSRGEKGEPVLQVGGLKVDLDRRLVHVDGRELHLTPIEYRLLSLLMRNAGRVMTHEQLLTEVWGPDRGEEAHYLRVYMHQLRHKIEQDPARPRYLQTEVGVGYRLRDE